MDSRLLALFLLASLFVASQGFFFRRRKPCGHHNCEWSSWGSWSECTSRCGCGTKTRCRSITKPASCGGRCDGAATDTASCCAHTCCKKDCKWGPWTDWSECQLVNPGAKCGAGREYRTRRVAQQASCGGKQCTGPCEQHRSCSVCCPRNCEWSSWGSWSDCTRSCGGGTKTRCRSVVKEAQCDGTCDGDGTQTVVCNHGCCPRNARWGPWGEWSTCSSGCGKPGWQVRTRKQAEAASCGGRPLNKNECKERKFCIGDCWGGSSSEEGCRKGKKCKGKGGKSKGKGSGSSSSESREKGCRGKKCYKSKGKSHKHKGKKKGKGSSSSESGSKSWRG